ncbi:MAG: DUF5696 domain-containing protein [Acutalibacteraceae bacterium]
MRNEKKNLRRISAGLAAALMLTFAPAKGSLQVKAEGVPPQIGITEETDAEYLTDYTLVTANGELALYADLKKGHIALENRKSGAFWYSVPNDFQTDSITTGEKRTDIFSELVVGYIEKSGENGAVDAITVNSHTDCVRNETVEVKEKEKGIRAEYTFTSINTVIPVEYTLTDKGLEASIPLDEIKTDDEFILVNIALLPYFGAGNSTDEGYLFIPDGCGALINFNNGVNTVSGYQAYVYGEEPSKDINSKKSNTAAVRMPVYGIQKNGEALFAVITEGDAMASISAKNGNSEMGYNSVWSQAELSVLSRTMLYEDSWQNRTTISKAATSSRSVVRYTVRYTCLSGENSGYTGMAKAYREYLVNEKGLTAAKTEGGALALSLYGAADKQAYFIGIPYTKTLALTSFKEAKDMLATLKEKGVDKTTVQYFGVFGTVLNGKLQNGASPISKLGGKSGFDELNKYIEENGGELYPELDYVRFRNGGNGYTRNGSASKNAFGYTAKQYEYLRSIYVRDESLDAYLLLSPKKLTGLADKILKKFTSLNVSGASMSAAGQLCYSDFDGKNGVYRSDIAGIYEGIFKKYSDSGISLAFKDANAYAFPYAERIYSAPASSSGYYMFDKDVPFYQIVLHGLVHLTGEPITSAADRETAFLFAAETGSELLFDGIAKDASVLSGTRYDYLYSTSFDLWSDTAADMYAEIKPLLEKTDKSVITSHSETGDLTVTVYENGTRVYVNYGADTVEYDGVSVPARDFAVVG